MKRRPTTNISVPYMFPRKFHRLYRDKLKHMVTKLQNPITRAKQLGEHFKLLEQLVKIFLVIKTMEADCYW